MSELLNCVGFFCRRLLKMYFKLPEWQEKNNNLKSGYIFFGSWEGILDFMQCDFQGDCFRSSKIQGGTCQTLTPPQEGDLWAVTAASCEWVSAWLSPGSGSPGFSGCPSYPAEPWDADKLLTRSSKNQSRIRALPRSQWGGRCKPMLRGGSLLSCVTVLQTSNG